MKEEDPGWASGATEEDAVDFTNELYEKSRRIDAIKEATLKRVNTVINIGPDKGLPFPKYLYLGANEYEIFTLVMRHDETRFFNGLPFFKGMQLFCVNAASHISASEERQESECYNL